MKRLFCGLISLSFLSITGCTSPSQDSGFFSNDFAQSEEFSSFANPRKNNLTTDWYATLRPELQAYYAPAKGKLGGELFDSLHNIISKNQNVTEYGPAKSFMYSTVDNVVIKSSPGLFDIYSYVFFPGRGGNGNSYKENGDANKDGTPNDFINCEHTWPQSFFNKQLPMVSDLHHLFPSMSVPNNMRGHLPFGMVKGTVVYSTIGGSKLGVIDKTGRNRPLAELIKIVNLPYEQKSVIMDRELDAVFEPGDKQKGNTSRALLYFYLRYIDHDIKSGEFDENNFWDSKVSTFTKWSEEVDPVDEQELRRHEIVFKNQGNRNPFIDIPNLASLIGEDVLRNK